MSDRTDEDSEWEMEIENDWIETAEINHANQAMHKIELQEQGADWRQTFERIPFVCKVVSFMAGDGYSLPLPSLLVWRTLSSADREAADNAASNTPIVAHVDLSFSVFYHHPPLTEQQSQRLIYCQNTDSMLQQYCIVVQIRFKR